MWTFFFFVNTNATTNILYFKHKGTDSLTSSNFLEIGRVFQRKNIIYSSVGVRKHFWQRDRANISGFVGHMVSVRIALKSLHRTAQLCCWSTKAVIDSMEKKGHVAFKWLCSVKTLFTKAGSTWKWLVDHSLLNPVLLW